MEFFSYDMLTCFWLTNLGFTIRSTRSPLFSGRSFIITSISRSLFSSVSVSLTSSTRVSRMSRDCMPVKQPKSHMVKGDTEVAYPVSSMTESRYWIRYITMSELLP